MIHARKDYDRIQDPAVNDESLLSDGSSPIKIDEPVFLIRAQDVCFESTVRAWMQFHSELGGDPFMSEALANHLQLASEWQSRNGRQLADAPIETLKLE